MRQTAIRMVHELARRDPRVVFVGSDLSAGLLADMKAEMPERFFMEGVSEAHVIGMAAGLAMDGFVPYVNTIATFLTRRCFEQLAIDVCLERLPVRLIGNGGGLVYAPLGPTHLATDDIALMRALPDMTVVCPADADEMARLMAVSPGCPGPLYIRLGKGGDPVVTGGRDGFAVGRAVPLRAGGEVVILATGVMTARALDAAAQLDRAGVLHLPTVKPLDVEAVLEAAAAARLVVTVEEHSRIGGLGSAVAETLADHGVLRPLERLALPDRFPEGYGSQDHLLEKAGLQPAQIAARVADRLARL